MIEVQNVSMVMNNANNVNCSLGIQFPVRGWVIPHKHDFKGEHDCVFKVTKFSTHLSMGDPYLMYMPEQMTISGHWARQGGKGWFEKEEWLHSWRQGSERITFEFIPDEVKEAVFSVTQHHVDLLSIVLKLNAEKLAKNKKFISKSYDPETETNEDGLPFLPTIKVTQLNPFIGDVSKWKCAKEERAWKPSGVSSIEEV